MISRRKLWKITFIVACLMCLSFFSTKISAFSTATDLELPSKVPAYDSIKILVSDFCSSVLKSSGFVQSGFVYTPKQSAFVHLLCRNMGTSSPYFAGQEEMYFKRTSFVQLGFQDIVSDSTNNQIDFCDTSYFQNDCDLSVNIPKLFNGIMNDYINMKQPNLYGMTKDFQTEPDVLNDQINIFSSAYFDGVEVCSDDEPRYPKTCKMMQSTLKNVRKALSDVSILNLSGIFHINKDKEAAKVSCATITESTDIFYCGLYGDTGSSLFSFVNLTYNELFYYRLFMGYYLSMINIHKSLLNDNTYMTNYASIYKTFSTQYMRSKDALSLSFRMMRDTYIAFPFHVGFSMYQEDLDGFGKALARMAPPIYTLYDKLRNVQKPQ